MKEKEKRDEHILRNNDMTYGCVHAKDIRKQTP